jgi:acyl-coenzyme A synthetase/AMP-(fatty) acid ligase
VSHSHQHTTAGEVRKAFVVLRGTAVAREIIDYVAARVSPQKRIHAVEFIAQIPRSAAGKILRRLLIRR